MSGHSRLVRLFSMFSMTLLFWVVQVSRVHVRSCLVECKLICGMVNQILTDRNTGNDRWKYRCVCVCDLFFIFCGELEDVVWA